MKFNNNEGLEYASPSIQTIEIASENAILSGSDDRRGFIVEDYEDDGTF